VYFTARELYGRGRVASPIESAETRSTQSVNAETEQAMLGPVELWNGLASIG